MLFLVSLYIKTPLTLVIPCKDLEERANRAKTAYSRSNSINANGGGPITTTRTDEKGNVVVTQQENGQQQINQMQQEAMVK